MQQRNKVVLDAIEMLRKTRKVVQLSPFVYTFLYIVILLLYNHASAMVLDVLDDLFYISPVVIAINLIYSRILKMCVWHKVACLLPLIPELANIYEAVPFDFSVGQATVINYAVVVCSVLFIVSAYKVFFSR